MYSDLDWGNALIKVKFEVKYIKDYKGGFQNTIYLHYWIIIIYPSMCLSLQRCIWGKCTLYFYMY